MLDQIAGHSFLTAPLADDAVVIDLGVNQAEFSREVSARYGCRIVGVEPVRELHADLPELPRSTFDQLAITAHNEPVTLHLNTDFDATIVPALRRGDSEPATVDGVTLPELLSRRDVAHAALVKVDIEGAELEMLETIDEGTLRRIDQLSVEFHDFLDASQRNAVLRCKRQMRERGFACIEFSRDNSDVLFVNQRRLRLPWWKRAWLLGRYKYPRGLRRALGRRIRRAPH